MRLRKQKILIPKKVNPMAPDNKSKRRALPVNYIRKTAGDFLRWRRAQDALKKQVVEDKIVQSDRDSSIAMMVWEDDGGAALTS